MLIAGTGGQIIGPYLYVVGREVVKLAGRAKQLLSVEHDWRRRRRICDWWPSWSSLSPPAPLSRTSPCTSCCSIFLPKMSGLRCPFLAWKTWAWGISLYNSLEESASSNNTLVNSCKLRINYNTHEVVGLMALLAERMVGTQQCDHNGRYLTKMYPTEELTCQ